MVNLRISISGLVITYDAHFSLSIPSLNVAGPRILGVIGPNGSGKSTLIKALAGLLSPTNAESLQVNGHDVLQRTREYRRTVGLVLDPTQLFDHLTCMQNMRYSSRLYGQRPDADKIMAWLDRVQLGAQASKKVQTLSTGMRQRLNIARALLPGASILILDEPTAGLDPVAAREFFKVVLDLAHQDTSVIVSTHNMREVQDICDHVLVLRDGRIIAEGGPSSLLSRFSGTLLEVRSTDREQQTLVGILGANGLASKHPRQTREGWSELIFSRPPQSLLEDERVEWQWRRTTLDDVYPALAGAEPC